MIRALKITTLVALIGGAAATVRYSGVWRDLPKLQGVIGVLFVCSPLFLFWAAAALGRHAVPIALTLCAALFAICAGISGYHDAFWSDHRSDINGIVLIYVPAVQGVIGLLALVGGFVDWLIYRRRHRFGGRPTYSRGT